MIILDTEPVKFTNIHLMEAFVFRAVTPRALNNWHMRPFDLWFGESSSPHKCSQFLAEEVSSFPV